MREHTMEQLEQWYSEAYNDLVVAVGKYSIDNGQKKHIDDLKCKVKELKEKIDFAKGIKKVSPTRYRKMLSDDLVDFVKDQETGHFLPYHNGNRLVIKARAKSEV